MAFFALNCWDKPGALEQRMKHRPEHVAYLKTQADVIRLAGPQMDADGAMNGSIFIIEVADRAAAEAFSASDPFKQLGVFGKVEIRGFTPTMGAWVP